MLRDDRYAALRAFICLLAAAILLALLLAACDGDADDDTAGGPLDELNALADRATEGATAKVTYAVTTSVDEETTESVQTVVQRPPQSRLDTFLSTDGEESHSTVINDGDKMYVCLAKGGEGSCLDVEPTSTAGQVALVQATLAVTVEHYSAIELFDMPRRSAENTDETVPLESSRQEIAGMDATCFTQETPGLEQELCFSEYGLTLYWYYLEVSADGVTRIFEATAISGSTDVTDEDFELPYELSEEETFDSDTPEP